MFICYCLTGVEVFFGVDATQLHSAAASGLNWREVDHLAWNFPLAVSAEQLDQSSAAAACATARDKKLLGDDDEANKQLMGRFLLSAARQMALSNPDMQVWAAACRCSGDP